MAHLKAAVQYFYTLSRKGHDFRGWGEIMEHKMCVFFYTSLVRNISHSTNYSARYDQKCTLVFM